jgi:hypothetical protein
MPSRIEVNDTVIYQLKRWQVVRVISQEQSPDPAAKHVPDKLRLLRGHDAITASADQVVQATPGKP